MSEHEVSSLIARTVEETLKHGKRRGGETLNRLLLLLATMIILAAVKLMTDDSRGDIKKTSTEQLDKLGTSFALISQVETDQQRMLQDHEYRIRIVERSVR